MSVKALPARHGIFADSGRVEFARQFIDSLYDTNTYVYAFLGKVTPWVRSIDIDGISQTSPILFESTGHGLSNDDLVTIRDVRGMTQINNYGGVPLRVINATLDTFELAGVDATSFGNYAGGGRIDLQLDNAWVRPNGSRRESEIARRAALAFKRVIAADATHVFRKQIWESDQSYDFCDESDPTLESKNYIVVNSAGRVYKCLANNAKGKSTVEPVSRSLTRFTNTDGYTWKYMFTLTPSERAKFETSEWAPVHDLTYNDGSDQWLIQRSAVSGTIDTGVVIQGGINYDENASVTIIGDGTGATAKIGGASSIGPEGQIVRLDITNPGADYTWAEAVVTHPTGSGVKIRLVISSDRGHGHDPVAELRARRVMVVSSFKGDNEGLFATGVDFRQYGLMTDLREIDESVAVGTDYDARESLILSNVIVNSTDNTAYVIGQKITGGVSGASAVVTGIVGSLLRISERTGQFEDGEPIVSDTGTGTLELFTPSQVDLMTGKVLYLENRGPSRRSSTNEDPFKTVLEF